METWKSIPFDPYVFHYSISDQGRVRRSNRMLRGNIASTGYRMVNLSCAGYRKYSLVHQLVALAFLGWPPGPIGITPGTYQVNHKDGDKTNNVASNLEWVTPQENTDHAIKMGLIDKARGEDHGTAKLTESLVREIRQAAYFVHHKGLAILYGISYGQVGKIIRKEHWTHI